MVNENTLPTADLSREEKIALLGDLKRALFTGATRIKFRERDVTYRSLAEIRQIISDLEDEINNVRKRRAVLTTFGRGL